MRVQATSLPCPDNALIGACFQKFIGKNFWAKICFVSLIPLQVKISQQVERTAIIPSMNNPISAAPRALDLAREVLDIEAAAVQALSARLDENFLHALNVILRCEGRVIVSGMGKSGHIARKIAATMSSTGTPAYFVHPGEASHGDLGMITSEDVIIALSYSGESQELVAIVPAIKRQGAKLISMTGNPASTLAKVSDVHLNAAVDKEACPMGLAPTTSTTAALALGDALAMALLDAKRNYPRTGRQPHSGPSLHRRCYSS
jgi:arabinose-5-phosphate isomerase